MVNLNKHKFLMMQILKDIYSNIELTSCLGFKGGTALMFFHNLPRFSVDLDFNLLDKNKKEKVLFLIKEMLLKYGKIDDEAIKFYSTIIVLNYGIGERKLKIEISNREWEEHYEIKNFLGINIKVMAKSDMFAHKLCALLDRSEVTNRDIFDSWFFMQHRTSLNKNIIEERMNIPYKDYIDKCINHLSNLSNKNILNGLGDLMDGEMKIFVKTKLLKETISLLNFYKEFPLL